MGHPPIEIILPTNQLRDTPCLQDPDTNQSASRRVRELAVRCVNHRNKYSAGNVQELGAGSFQSFSEVSEIWELLL